MSSADSTRRTGTREWSVASVNCVLGCPHRCRYCYARARAVKFHQCPSAEAWGTTYHHLRQSEVRRRRGLYSGLVMFPTSHDITPHFLPGCLEVLRKLLAAGNQVLIVSKPHLAVISEVCSQFAIFREQILFRFTIGATNQRILAYWEPGAPDIYERMAALRHAHRLGFQTSISAEPLLDAPGAERLVGMVDPYVTETIWIGKLNEIHSRVVSGTDPDEIARIERGQTQESIQRVHAQLAGHSKIRWKDSYRSALFAS